MRTEKIEMGVNVFFLSFWLRFCSASESSICKTKFTAILAASVSYVIRTPYYSYLVEI